MCKTCETLIGCSCYCKDSWHSTAYNQAKKKDEPFCAKCNHALPS